MRRLFRPARFLLAVLLAAECTAAIARAQRQMEALGRGVVAVRTSAAEVFISWRLLGTDSVLAAFNVYRGTDHGAAVRLNATPVTDATWLSDRGAELGRDHSYFVRVLPDGMTEGPPSAAFVLPASAPVRPYLALPLEVPGGGTTPAGEAYAYRPNDCSVGDLDGDGEYEMVVKWEPSNAKDNSQSGYTGPVLLDGYRLDGTRLWRLDLGVNIRAGAHYTQFLVYDFDGDGRAEVACKTAPGTIDGLGRPVLLPGDDPAADHRNSAGYILSGPEYLTVFDGRTGAALATAPYLPPRGSVAAWGDNYGNRVDRFLACVAYLDGRRPSLVMCRGYYTRTVLAAWDWRDGRLDLRWVFDSDDGSPGHAAFRGEGNHNLAVADVDDDGRDEIVYGACVIDDNGRGLYASGLRHGDALHVGDLDPDRPGLEVWSCHEDVNGNGHIGLSLRDARTGERLFTVRNTRDTGRAVAIDIDPRHRGYELWGATGGLYSATGELLGPRPSSMNFAVWWDGDLLREILDGTAIDKWDWERSASTRLLTAAGCAANNGTKATPALSADLFGDWREEVIWRSADNRELRIFTTTHPTDHRLPTLMHDPQYRLAVAWQNVAYNQPPHPGFFLGEGMARPPVALIRAGNRPGRLANLSVRAGVDAAEGPLIAGFAASGPGAVPVLVRAVGPTLAVFGVSDVLVDPRLVVYTGGNVTTVSDNWSAEPQAEAIAAQALALGAFPLSRPGNDSALLLTVPPGLYTAHLLASPGTRGTGLLEFYADSAGGGSARLSNLSVRAQLVPGAPPLAAGFVLEAASTRTVLVRVVGPSLARFGVRETLRDPSLTLFRGGSRIAGNDDWHRDGGATAAACSAAGAFPLETGSRDAALLMHLPAGAYSIHAGSADGTGGAVLIEVYAWED